MKPIIFLSRLLTSAEKNYWPTKLEIAEFVWVLKKIRHIIESSQHPIMIQTDHSAILDIIKQNSIVSTTSTMRINVRLVRASQFLRQFNLEVRHKPKKEYIISDALSRLASVNHGQESEIPQYSELDVLFTCSLVEMSDDFRHRLVKGYKSDPWYSRLLRQIDENERIGEDAVMLSFIRGQPDDPESSSNPRSSHSPPERISSRTPESSSSPLPNTSKNSSSSEDLIYHIDRVTENQRLCISSALVKEILHLTHENDHPRFQRCYEIVSASWYIRGLFNLLREFIRHYPKCQVLQIRRHQSYESLSPIESPFIPFHTLTLNFILALSTSEEDNYDTILSITDKFIKRTTDIQGKFIWNTAQWAEALINRLELIDWKIPKTIISDRDRKFLSELWQAIFKRLGVSLLYFTAYHPQTNDSSERTNQTMEIAMRFYIHTLEKPSL